MSARNGTKPAGFTPPPKNVAELKFTDGDYEGAVVSCSLSASIGLYLELSRGAAGSEELAVLFTRFGDELLIEWNVLNKRGEPLPANAEGMLAVDADFAQAVLSAWLDAKVAVAAPLESASSAGDGSPEESTQMETSSESPPN